MAKWVEFFGGNNARNVGVRTIYVYDQKVGLKQESRSRLSLEMAFANGAMTSCMYSPCIWISGWFLMAKELDFVCRN